MKRVGKSVFFIVLALILVITTLAFTGLHTQYADVTKTWIKGAGDIRWGIDIQGGVDATFSPADGYSATEDQLNAAKAVMEVRMVSLNITDYEIYADTNKSRIIVRFPWKEGEADFNPEKAIQELGETALLTFREGIIFDESTGLIGAPPEEIILEGMDVTNASPAWNDDQPVVALTLSAEGAAKFAEATERLQGEIISIWMDDTILSYPSVQEPITGGEAIITGSESIQEARELADKINAGALPFKLVTENYNTISPSLGEGALNAMVLAGIIAFVLIALLMISMYRLPGVIAVFGLAGQIGLMIASISGFFPWMNSFTLTLPGIAGIILSVGMGVDCNVITAERIKEELRNGRTIDGAIDTGYKRAFTAIFDGNITVIIVAVILMGAFGTPGSFFSTLLTPFFFMFGPATAGNIYSFGYTLLMGVILNFVMGIFACRLMVKSVSRQSALRKTWLYGGESK